MISTMLAGVNQQWHISMTVSLTIVGLVDATLQEVLLLHLFRDKLEGLKDVLLFVASSISFGISPAQLYPVVHKTFISKFRG